MTSSNTPEPNEQRAWWTITPAGPSVPDDTAKAAPAGTDVARPGAAGTELAHPAGTTMTAAERADLARLMATARAVGPWIGPVPYDAGGAGHGTPPVPPEQGGSRPSGNRRRPVVVAGAIALALVVAGGVAWSALGGRPDPGDAVAAATDDLSTWESVTYRGRITQISAGDLDVDITVNRDGDAAGTLALPEGGRAEYARIDGIEMLRADDAWFADEIDLVDRAGRLANRWVKNPMGEVYALDTVLKPPGDLAGDLGGHLPELPSGVGWSPWSDGGTSDVDGTPARRITGIGDELFVTDGADPRLLGYRPTFVTTGPSMLQVAPGTPEALDAVGAARGARDTAVDYQQRLSAAPEVTVEWATPPPGTCPESCSATVRVTNAETFPATGSVTAMTNGRIADVESFDLAPGASATLTFTGYRPWDGPATRWTTETRAY
ncbi:hypothetical protein [Pseudonocardia sp. HH130630-07]|uniref:hypothetical protein n=1 Tax=Pseudonocardia sp. HH130630-07 TaxID=1690815 RepID=UPI000814B95C|nr:hypothetical protein [Pseudonocardia sp. HH130630-07]ANY08354.1 hypothetical protein AFB00_21075 [Pseudonocardia sp. HH130630-07]